MAKEILKIRSDFLSENVTQKRKHFKGQNEALGNIFATTRMRNTFLQIDFKS